MAAIYPIPVGRGSDALMTRRLMSQLQAQQRRLLQVQQQLGTGRRIQLSSEDPASASRATTLQRMLEIKNQLTTNLSTTRSYLDAADNALGSVAGLLAAARGLAVRAADSTTSDLEREAMAQEIQATIRQLLDVANQTFRGRYLFAGSQLTSRPFESVGNRVAYLGNDVNLRSYASQVELFDTNVPGQELFGAVSRDVRGIDLDPVLNPMTRLTDLNGGLGVSDGILVVSDGSSTSRVDLSGAETLADVKRLIEASPPAGRTLLVTIGASGLQVDIDATGGSLTIQEEFGGTTAADLGILRTSGLASDPIIGRDLNPALRLTTRLDQLGGIGGPWDQNSGLQIVNGGETHLIDLQQAETVEDLLNLFNASGAMVLAEINEAQNGINVRSRLSGSDFSIGENGGTTANDLGLRTLTRDTPLSQLNYRRGVDVADGIDFTIERSDGVALDIDISTAQTVGDVIDLINNHPDNLDPNTAVVAQLNAYSNGIALSNDHPLGVQALTVKRSPISFAAWDLGLVPRGELASLPADPPSQPASVAIAFAPPNDINTALRIAAATSGTALNGVDIEFRSTLVGDTATASFDPVAGRLIIDMADGQTTANTVISALTAEGTFTATLDLTTDPANDGTGTIVAPPGVAATTSGGTAETLNGQDANPIETQGVFNSLIRLQAAIEQFDVPAVMRIVDMLDADFDRLIFGRAEVGARGESLEAFDVRNEDEKIDLSAVLSEEMDVDFAQAASDLAARQVAYEASLRSLAGLLHLSLLDFL